MFEDTSEYNDIIELPHVEPIGRKRLSSWEHANQFSAFDALTGLGESIEEETSKILKEYTINDEEQKGALAKMKAFFEQANLPYEAANEYFHSIFGQDAQLKDFL